MKKKESGITLVALVVTIIVLLILATVSINFILGENGIITRAKQAKVETENAALLEEENLRKSEEILSQDFSKPSVNVYDKDKEPGRSNPVIPKGFETVNIDTAKWGEDGAEENGLVIQDEQENQFVWVPVDGVDELNEKTVLDIANPANTSVIYGKHKYEKEQVDDNVRLVKDTGNGEWMTNTYRKYGDAWKDDEDYQKKINSVKKYGGFYIARYESGLNDNSEFKVTDENRLDPYYTSNKYEDLPPVSKSGVQVWNIISQQDAVNVAKKMYNEKDAESYLIDSYAWDTVATWLYKTGNNINDGSGCGNYYNNEYKFIGGYAPHVYDKGWKLKQYQITTVERTKAAESGTELMTGVDINIGGKQHANRCNNIYDFSGNMYEWTSETSNDNTRAVLRGGGFNNSGVSYPACYRESMELDYPSITVGFRVVLYIK